MQDFDVTTRWPRAGAPGAFTPATSAPAGLSTTMSAALAELRHTGRCDDALEVLASCLRLRQDARLLLQHRGRIRALTVYPHLAQGLLPPPMGRGARPRGRTPHQDLALIAVEAAGPVPATGLQPLAPLLWWLAWQAPGPRLLSALRGDLAFRLAPGLAHSAWFPPALAAAARRLQHEPTPLAVLAQWPGLDRAQAVRLLNGAYLQGGLMRLQALGHGRRPVH